jgi:hypothetical protein
VLRSTQHVSAPGGVYLIANQHARDIQVATHELDSHAMANHHIDVPVKARRSIFKFLFCWCAPSQAPGGFKSDSLQNDLPLTPAICQNEAAPIVGPVDETWVAPAWRGNQDEPISRWTLAGVPQNYSPRLFKSRGLACSPYPRVGHAVSQENQLKVLHDSCLLRPLAKCQVFDMCGGTSSAMPRCL